MERQRCRRSHCEKSLQICVRVKFEWLKNLGQWTDSNCLSFRLMKAIVQREKPLQPLVLEVVSLDRLERGSRERREVISSDDTWLSLVRREGIRPRYCAVVRWVDKDALQ